MRWVMLTVAVFGNLAGMLWGTHPFTLFFAAAFGYSIRWAMDEITAGQSGSKETR